MTTQTRKQVLSWAGGTAALLAAGALWGDYDAAYGRFWMIKANGSIRSFSWGLASVGLTAWTLVFALVSSERFHRWRMRVPRIAKTAWLAAAFGLTLLMVAIVLLLVSMPIA